MIRIRKPGQAPLLLRERGARLTLELCTMVDAGERPSFDRDVYGADQVKQALSLAQYGKCCFCECKLSHAQFGDVEHFRPKGRAQQDAAVTPTSGYYWLAYAWDNLYLSCEVCNRRHKRDLFPLLNPDRRVVSHHRSLELEAEQPVFIDPGREDPAAFIEFRREFAAPVAGARRGGATINALQLNRPALRDRRRERRQQLMACAIVVTKAIEIDPSTGARKEAIYVLNIIIAAATDQGEYSSMTRSLLRQIAPWRRDWRAPAEALLDELRAEAAAGCVFQLDELRSPPPA
jgi:uncharacterized protein (TIGR02646 family)